MSTARIIGIILLALGLVLVVVGINASDSFTEQLREDFTGRFSDATMFYIIGGVVAVAAGVALLLAGGRRHRPAT